MESESTKWTLEFSMIPHPTNSVALLPIYFIMNDNQLFNSSADEIDKSTLTVTCITDMVDNNDGSRFSKDLELRLFILVVGQSVDWLDESEVLREELGGPGQHQLVALLQSGFGHS